jgi:DNA-binding transcriptional LysR family regulator
MDIDSLGIFCDLAELKSFSKVAEKHLLSQSAISQQLAQLELIHRCQLIDRRRRPIELTKAGQLFYETCKDIVAKYDKFRIELSALQKSPEEHIKIGATYSIGMFTLPEHVKKFILKYPDVKIDIEYLDSDEIYRRVLTGDIDLGLVAVPKNDKRIRVYETGKEALVLICSPKNPLANQTKVDIQKVQFEKFVAFGLNHPMRKWIDDTLQQYKISVQPVSEFDNIEIIKRAVEVDAGVSIVPKPAIVQEVRNGTLKAITFSNAKISRTPRVIVRKNRQLERSAQYFIELLREQPADKPSAQPAQM